MPKAGTAKSGFRRIACQRLLGTNPKQKILVYRKQPVRWAARAAPAVPATCRAALSNSLGVFDLMPGTFHPRPAIRKNISVTKLLHSTGTGFGWPDAAERCKEQQSAEH
jgi:hypothetical protein